MSDAESMEGHSLAVAHRPLVLVVDDDDGIRDALRDLLEDAGFATLGARHGLEALNVLGALPAAPAFILLDLMMPVMDGWEFRRRQMDDPAIAKVPVVVLSAVDQSRAQDLAGALFLKKPLDFDRLLQLVRRFCAPVDC